MTEPPRSVEDRASLASELDVAVRDVEESPSAETAFLVGLSGRYAGKLFRLKPGESLIGRASTALVSLNEKAVSHQHARLFLNSQGCYITDLESTNGTYVNDVRISSATGLHAGDVIRCGTSNFGFLTDAEDDGQHTRAMARLTATPATGVTRSPGALATRHSVPLGRSPAQRSTAMAVDGSLVQSESEGSLLDTLDMLLDRLALAWEFVRQYWKVILASVVFLACLGGASVELNMPPSSASCEVLLRGEADPHRRDKERLVDYFEMVGKNWTAPELVQRTMRDMQMRSLKPDVVRAIAGSLTFDPQAPGNYLLTFTHEDSDFAERFLAAHVKNFLETEIGKAIAVVKSEADLLNQQYEENEAELRGVERRLAEFKGRNLDALPENMASQLTSRATDAGRRDMLSAQLERYSQELALAKRTLASGSYRATSQQARVAPYQESLVGVQQELASLQAKGFAESHPEVLELKAKKRELEELIRSAQRAPETDADRLVNQAYQEQVQEVGRLEVLVNATRKELGLLEGRMQKTDELAEKVPQVELEYADLLRRLEAAKAQHQILHRRLKDKELQLELERASVAARYEIIRQPEVTVSSKTKVALKRAAMGGASGLMLGILLALSHWLVSYSRARQPRDLTDKKALVRVSD